MRNIIIRTAQSFDQKTIASIKARFEEILNVPLRCRVELDPSLIGGFMAFAGGTIYDFSFKTQLDTLRSERGKDGNVRLHRI